MSFNPLNIAFPWWAKLLLALLLIGSIFAAGAKTGYTFRDDAAQKEAVSAQQKANKQLRDVQTQLEIALGEKQKVSDELQQLQKTQTDIAAANKTKLKKEVASKPVYNQCVVPPTGVDQINNQAKQLNGLRSSLHE